MASFKQALRKILKHEGVAFFEDGLPDPKKTGYVHHPNDPGGETNYGVTMKTARGFGYAGLMREIPYETVEKIYKSLYWDKLLGDFIEDQDIAEELFDTGVNAGVQTVVLFLQRGLNVLNKNGTLYDDLKPDGVCGQVTVGILNKACKVTSYHKLCILRALDSLQCVLYIKLAEQNEKFETFVPGWLLNRVGVKE